jgi:2,4-dienoyl-CoA reductase-like NADH-dependent reductase (Old Yellow Enzyme family)
VVRKESLEGPELNMWKEWASIAQAKGTPCIVQLAHPGRMSPKGAGLRPDDMPPICPSSVPVQLGDRWIDKKAIEMMIGTPREATLQDIDEAVEAFVVGAKVAEAAGFKGVQIHAAVSQIQDIEWVDF